VVTSTGARPHLTCGGFNVFNVSFNRDSWAWGSAALTTRHSLPAKLALTSPPNGSRRSVQFACGPKATEFLTLKNI
jgi:hypothetical protein